MSIPTGSKFADGNFRYKFGSFKVSVNGYGWNNYKGWFFYIRLKGWIL